MRKSSAIKILLFCFSVIVIFAPIVLGDNENELENFQKYNPDGQKFQFVKDYLTSLGYLHTNVQRGEDLFFSEAKRASSERLDVLERNLIADNVGLRVARNTLNKYQRATNGVMQKIHSLFDQYCNMIISVNNQERQLIQDAKSGKIKNPIGQFDNRFFLQEQAKLADSRQEAAKKLVEASMLVRKVLISEKPDTSGEFTNLAVTRKEKRKLLSKIDEFYGEGFSGSLREGQSYLQASVASIREILEDNRYQIMNN